MYLDMAIPLGIWGEFEILQQSVANNDNKETEQREQIAF